MRAPDIQHTLPPLSQPALQQVRLHITVCSLDTYLIFEVLRSRGSLTRLAQPIRMVYRQLPLPDRQSTTQESRLDTCICYQAEADWLIAASLLAQGMLFLTISASKMTVQICWSLTQVLHYRMRHKRSSTRLSSPSATRPCLPALVPSLKRCRDASAISWPMRVPNPLQPQQQPRPQQLQQPPLTVRQPDLRRQMTTAS